MAVAIAGSNHVSVSCAHRSVVANLEFGAKGRRLGVEYDAYGLTAKNGKLLEAALADFCTLEDASDIVSRLRVVKSAAEMEYVRKAAGLADLAYDEAYRLAGAGTDEGDILAAMQGVIFAGGGVILSKGSGELTAFARHLQIPVTTSLMGLGAFEESDSLSLGMIGMHGTYRANMCTAECDLILAVGVRFDDRVTGKTDAFAAQSQIVHIDIDPTTIRKNIPVTVPVVGDCKTSLKQLNKFIDEIDLGDLDQKRKKWFEQIEEWKSTKSLAYEQSEDTIKPQYVVEKLYELTKGQAIITTEVGQNQMWAAQYYHFDEPNHFITSGGLGVMGFGLPAAIGAKAARPDKLVVDVAGDGGSFGFNADVIGV